MILSMGTTQRIMPTLLGCHWSLAFVSVCEASCWDSENGKSRAVINTHHQERFIPKKISQCNRTTPNIPVNLQEEVPKPHFDTLGGFGWLKLSTAVGIHMAKVVLNLEMVVFLSQALKPHSLSEENLQARWILLELLSGMCRQGYLFKYRFRISCLLKSLYKEMRSVSLLLALWFPVRCTSTGSAFEY